MKNKRILILVVVAALVLVGLLMAATRAWARADGAQALAPAAPAASASIVSSTISYQGRLLDSDGNPVEGTRVLTFRLYTAVLGGSPLWSQTGSVLVDDGLFTAYLDVDPALFDGRALWLGVQVQGDAQELSPRQPLLPAPYALSLRPGAIISSSGIDVLHIWNLAGGYGVEAWSQNSIGLLGTSGSVGTPPSGMHGVHGIGDAVGVYGEGGHTGVYGNGTNDGVKGESTSGNAVHGLGTNGSGVLGESTSGAGVRGVSNTDYGVVGVAKGPNRSGVYGHSDSSHGVMGRTTCAASTCAGVYGVNSGLGPAIYSDGDLFVTGAFRGNIGPNNGAPFPRPAFDSGWLSISTGTLNVITHSLGGNPDNYVVDLQFRDAVYGRGVHNLKYGGWTDGSLFQGAWWEQLTAQHIVVARGAGDIEIADVRVRIWVYR
jgi:hypothetical protein